MYPVGGTKDSRRKQHTRVNQDASSRRNSGGRSGRSPVTAAGAGTEAVSHKDAVLGNTL